MRYDVSQGRHLTNRTLLSRPTPICSQSFSEIASPDNILRRSDSAVLHRHGITLCYHTPVSGGVLQQMHDKMFRTTFTNRIDSGQSAQNEIKLQLKRVYDRLTVMMNGKILKEVFLALPNSPIFPAKGLHFMDAFFSFWEENLSLKGNSHFGKAFFVHGSTQTVLNMCPIYKSGEKNSGVYYRWYWGVDRKIRHEGHCSAQ